MKILIGNVGSTSLKTKLLNFDRNNQFSVLGEANISRVHSDLKSEFRTMRSNCQEKIKEIEIKGLKKCIRLILDWYRNADIIKSDSAIAAMGFKCVMGETNGANLLTPAILS